MATSIIENKISFVIPVYNEAEVIENTIAIVYKTLNENHRPFELIIGNDGSNDNTLNVLNRLKQNYPFLRIINFSKNHGRGAILSEAILQSDGEHIVYTDADLAVDLSSLEAAKYYAQRGYDVVIGSKHLPESIVDYPIMRRFLSVMYSRITEFLLSIDVSDFQCGFKMFRKKSIVNIISDVNNPGWSWDTELLLRAYDNGLRIKEIPVIVRNINMRKSKVKLLKDSVTMGIALFKLWHIRRHRLLN